MKYSVLSLKSDSTSVLVQARSQKHLNACPIKDHMLSLIICLCLLWTNVYVPPEFIIRNTNPQYDSIRSWGLWKEMINESGALMAEVGALTKETLHSSLLLLLKWGYNEKMAAQKRILHRQCWHHCRHICEKTFLVFTSYSVCGVLL